MRSWAFAPIALAGAFQLGALIAQGGPRDNALSRLTVV